MKKTYDRPHIRTFFPHSPALMISTSITVNEYKSGDDITVGDTDEEEEESGSAKAYDYAVDWNE